MTALRIVAVIYRLLGSVIGLLGVIGLFVSLNPQTGANTPLGPFAVTFSLAFLLASVSCFAFAELLEFLFRFDEKLESYTTHLHILEARLQTLANITDKHTALLERIAKAAENQKENAQLAEITRHVQATSIASDRTAYATEILSSTVTNRTRPPQ